MRIAHLSDPHLLSLDSVPTSRLLLNKRATGWINLRVRRRSHHHREVVEAMLADVRAQNVDHIVVTGDLTNLALEQEFALARRIFDALGFQPEQLSIVPGNHDLYTRGAQRGQRFAKFFSPNITSDLPASLSSAHPSGQFPFVRLRDDVAIIGLSSAIARLPLFASGHAGSAQLEALERILEHPEVRRRIPVLLTHHPLVNPRDPVRTWLHGFREGPALRRIMHARPHTMVLHGHLHGREHRVFRHQGSVVHHVGATSASLVHASPDRMAGYNVYELGPSGLERASVRVYSPLDGGFHERTIPKTEG